MKELEILLNALKNFARLRIFGDKTNLKIIDVVLNYIIVRYALDFFKKNQKYFETYQLSLEVFEKL